MSHETTIRDLDQEQSRLKETMSRLEGEREALLNQSQADDDAHCQQVVKLEQVGGAACLTSGMGVPTSGCDCSRPFGSAHFRLGVAHFLLGMHMSGFEGPLSVDSVPFRLGMTTSG